MSSLWFLEGVKVGLAVVDSFDAATPSRLHVGLGITTVRVEAAQGSVTVFCAGATED